jgi:rod shape-determining protein MreB and related proteins
MMFTKRIGIDLGTANSVVWLAGTGVVMNEPTVVAVTIDDNRVVAVGNEAKDMLGRTPGNIVATRPMRDGVIADYRLTEAMLRYFLDRVAGRNRIFKPEVMVCVPSGVTQVERRAVLDATLSAGAKVAYLIEEPLAAAIGAKIPIAQASGNMIVDIGGGSTESAVISLGGVVVHKSARVAGNKLDEAISQFVKKSYNLIIGERMSEMIKITIGNAIASDVKKKSESQTIRPASYPIQSNKQKAESRGQIAEINEISETEESRKQKAEGGKQRAEYGRENPKIKIDQPSAISLPPSGVMEVRGRDAISGLPRLIELSAPEVTVAVAPILHQIINCVKSVLEETPPELAADIIDKGIVMAGGTSQLKNFDKLMTQMTGVVCHVADDPLLCVVKGTGIALENIELYKRSVSRK